MVSNNPIETSEVSNSVRTAQRVSAVALGWRIESPHKSAGIRRVKGVRRIGVRTGNWLTAEQGRRLPNLLQLGVLIATAMPATSLAGPPIALQRVLFGMLGWLGRLAGYKTAYREYGVITVGGLEIRA